MYNIPVVGLFKPLSYQARAVQLALTDDETDQVCFEPHELPTIAALIRSELVRL